MHEHVNHILSSFVSTCQSGLIINVLTKCEWVLVVASQKNLYPQQTSVCKHFFSKNLNWKTELVFDKKVVFTFNACTTRKEAGSTLHAWAGVLWISSDEDDSRYFLGLKFLIPGFFWWVNLLSFFWGGLI